MMTFRCWTKQKQKECENFIRNGSLLQEDIIAVCKGKNLPIHVFSANVVTKMSTFTSSDYLIKDVHYQMFRGTIDEGNRPVFIKKFHSTHSFVGVEGIVREIVTATQMCMHQNSLKPIGCCLETELPVIVYEFPDQGCLLDIISNMGFLPWKLRLKIGSEISYALAYLQNGFFRPVIFRNLSIKDVYFDKDYVAKLTGYYFSVLIPEGEDHVNDAVVGTTGDTAPEYISSGRLTEKTDVYCFGVLLFELLAGRNRFTECYNFQLYRITGHDQNITISMIVDPEISCEIEESGKQQQLQEVFELAWRCTYRNEDDRPSMIEVASGDAHIERKLQTLISSVELSQINVISNPNFEGQLVAIVFLKYWYYW